MVHDTSSSPPQTPEPNLPLAAEFPSIGEAEWRRLVEAALKGPSFDKRLVSETYDGLRVQPLYPRAMGAKPIPGRAPGAAWTVMQRIDHPDPAAANKHALDDLENGATGLTLVFAGSLNANGYGLASSPEAIARALEGVQLDAGITIDFNLSLATRDAVQHFVALVKSRKITPASVDLRASLNPIGGLAASGISPRPWSELSKSLAASVRELAAQGYRGPFMVADGRIIHNAGGSEAQELSFALAAALDCLRALEAAGTPLDIASGMIYFRLAADDDQFLTIAKFRAIRKLWARIEEACGLAPKRATVAAETAWRMMTKRDPHVNMLRTTIAVAAAGLGGADNIATLPHTAALGLPDQFARRIARNTQLILLEESNLAKVSDPAAGSGAIEDLTNRLCAAAWAQFQDIEKAGGAWAALEQGLIQKKVAAVRTAREAAVARRKDALTGTSDYPDLNEKTPALVSVAPAPVPPAPTSVAAAPPLPSLRLAEPFEALRDASDRMLAATGARPKVFLANLGRPSDFTTRATFARNFYEAGGIEAVTNDGFARSSPPPGGGRSTAAGGREGVTTSASDGASPHPGRFAADPLPRGEGETNITALLAAFKASGAKLACLCSSVEVYAREAVTAAQALTAAGATVHLAGRPADNEAAWRQASVKSFIYMGCDALATLRAAHDILVK
ncbi:MAG TPA: methylmalonyl-CoA mutase subunit beta [Pseudolabrys sp.]|nr:methylmalonyl-CoA mutase subunit beta [Pseudolabrys sp.]